jgi:predicted adenylyl cyclase CyaB
MKQKNIEIEIRSLIDEKMYKKLLRFFKKEGRFIGKENQISYYFSGKDDLRIQKSDKYAKIWLKKGMLHDNSRKEIEVKLELSEFENASRLFESLGFKNEIIWLRTRNIFSWKNVKIMLDNTKGYGYIIELEKMGDLESKDEILKDLKRKMEILGIKETSKEDFDKKFKYYKNNWKKLIV